MKARTVLLTPTVMPVEFVAPRVSAKMAVATSVPATELRSVKQTPVAAKKAQRVTTMMIVWMVATAPTHNVAIPVLETMIAPEPANVQVTGGVPSLTYVRAAKTVMPDGCVSVIDVEMPALPAIAVLGSSVTKTRANVKSPSSARVTTNALETVFVSETNVVSPVVTIVNVSLRDSAPPMVAA